MALELMANGFWDRVRSNIQRTTVIVSGSAPQQLHAYKARRCADATVRADSRLWRFRPLARKPISSPWAIRAAIFGLVSRTEPSYPGADKRPERSSAASGAAE